MFDQRKFQFHVARCKDRRGKQVFNCQYYHAHIYTSLQSLLQHEKECCKRPADTVKEENEAGSPMVECPEDNATTCDEREPGDKSNRQPSCCYCSFNVEHVFKSLKERETHEEVCPQRDEYTKKMKQSGEIYQRHKNQLKNAAHQRKSQMEELYGHHNGPQARDMPNLKYKYRMNEPFLGGEQDQYASSHDQVNFKLKHVYNVGNEDQGKVKNLDEQKEELQDEFMREFTNKAAPDIDTFKVNQDQEELFGLKIVSRHSNSANGLFDFDIEDYISLLQLIEMLKLPSECLSQWGQSQWTAFIEENCLLKLSKVETGKRSWIELAAAQIEQFSMACLNPVPSLRRTICLNSTRGNQIKAESKDGEMVEDLENKQTYLVLINKSTEVLGPYMDSDFALFSVTVDLPPQDPLVKIQAVSNKDPVIIELEQEKVDLEMQLKEAQGEIVDLNKNQETLEKIMKDKERLARQDAKQIEFLQKDKLLIKGEVKSFQEMLSSKETEVRNVEKELEHRKCEVKSIQNRFDREKQKSEQFQEKFNKASVQLTQCTNLLSEANKAIKTKDLNLKKTEEKVEQLTQFAKQITKLNNGQSLQVNPLTIAKTATQAAGATTAKESISMEEIERRVAQGDNSLITQVVASDAKEEVTFGANAKETTQQRQASAPGSKSKGEDDEMMMDAEILDDDIDEEKIRINKLEQMASNTLRSQSQSKQDQSAGSSALVSAQHSSRATPARPLKEGETPYPVDACDGLPEDLLCIMCLNARKEVLIVTCKHLVFCKTCDRDYSLKNHIKKECPICRKEYKKTIPIYYS